jgi:hypothetical protein
LVAVFWLVLFDFWTFPTGATRRLVTLCDFEIAAFQAFFDHGRLNAALTFAGPATTFDFRRSAMILFVGAMFRMFRNVLGKAVVGLFSELILTRFGRVSGFFPISGIFSISGIFPIPGIFPISGILRIFGLQGHCIFARWSPFLWIDGRSGVDL